jgi:hypothetical protein
VIRDRAGRNNGIKWRENKRFNCSNRKSKARAFFFPPAVDEYEDEDDDEEEEDEDELVAAGVIGEDAGADACVDACLCVCVCVITRAIRTTRNVLCELSTLSPLEPLELPLE